MGYIRIGTIINTHGLKGEAKIESYSDFDEIRYEKGNTVLILVNDELVPATVRSFRVHKGYPLVAFEEYPTINEIEPLKNCDVYILDSDRHELPEGEYYFDELIGMEVEDEEGHLIGTVIDVEETNGAQNNLRVEREGQSDVLIPNVPFFVKKIDEDANRITVHVIEGLL